MTDKIKDLIKEDYDFYTNVFYFNKKNPASFSDDERNIYTNQVNNFSTLINLLIEEINKRTNKEDKEEYIISYIELAFENNNYPLILLLLPKYREIVGHDDAKLIDIKHNKYNIVLQHIINKNGDFKLIEQLKTPCSMNSDLPLVDINDLSSKILSETVKPDDNNLIIQLILDGNFDAISYMIDQNFIMAENVKNVMQNGVVKPYDNNLIIQLILDGNFDAINYIRTKRLISGENITKAIKNEVIKPNNNNLIIQLIFDDKFDTIEKFILKFITTEDSKRIIKESIIKPHNCPAIFYIINNFNVENIKKFVDLGFISKDDVVSIINEKKDSAGNYILHNIIKNNNIEKLDYIVSLENVNLNIQNDEGMTPLMYAIKNNKKEAFDILINKGANVNILDNNDISPLRLAINEGRFDMVNMLVNAGADVNKTFEDIDRSLLYLLVIKACSIDDPLQFNFHCRTIENFISKGISLDYGNYDDMLQQIIQYKRPDIFNLVLQKLDKNKIDFKIENVLAVVLENVTSADFITCLKKQYPSEYNKPQTIFDVLIKINPITKVKPESFQQLLKSIDSKENVFNLLKIAIESNKVDIFECIANNLLKIDKFKDYFKPSFMHACFDIIIDRGIKYEDCKDLIDLSLSKYGKQTVISENSTVKAIDYQDKNGNTLLHKLVLKNRSDLIKSLVENGANPNIQNKEGNTIMHLAARNEVEINNFGLLLDLDGINFDILNNDGYSPLTLIIKNNDILKFVRLVNSKNVNLNLENNEGLTPLLYTIQENNLKMFNILIGKGVNINLENKNGISPLMYAINQRNYDMFNKLIEAGANINSKDKNNGNTLLHIAVTKKDLKLVKFLIEKGANIDLQNKYGNTPLHLAVPYGYKDIVNFLIFQGANTNIKNEKNQTVYDIVNKTTFNNKYIKGQVNKKHVKDKEEERKKREREEIEKREGEEIEKEKIEKDKIEQEKKRLETQEIIKTHIESVKKNEENDRNAKIANNFLKADSVNYNDGYAILQMFVDQDQYNSLLDFILSILSRCGNNISFLSNLGRLFDFTEEENNRIAERIIVVFNEGNYSEENIESIMNFINYLNDKKLYNIKDKFLNSFNEAIKAKRDNQQINEKVYNSLNSYIESEQKVNEVTKDKVKTTVDDILKKEEFGENFKEKNEMEKLQKILCNYIIENAKFLVLLNETYKKFIFEAVMKQVIQMNIMKQSVFSSKLALSNLFMKTIKQLLLQQQNTADGLEI